MRKYFAEIFNAHAARTKHYFTVKTMRNPFVARPV